MLGYAPQQQAELDGLDRLLAELQRNRSQWQPSRPMAEQLAPVVQRIAQERQSPQTVIQDGMVGQETTFSPSNVDDIIARSVARNRLAASDAMTIDPGHYQALRAQAPARELGPGEVSWEDRARQAEVKQNFANIKAEGGTYGAGENLGSVGGRPTNHNDFVRRNAVRAAGRGVLNPYMGADLVNRGVVPTGVLGPPAFTGGDLESLLGSGQLQQLAPGQRAEMLLKAMALRDQRSASEAANALARQQMAQNSSDKRYAVDQEAAGATARNDLAREELGLKREALATTVDETKRDRGLLPPTAVQSAQAIGRNATPDQVTAALGDLQVPDDQAEAVRMALTQLGYGPDFFNQMADDAAPKPQGILSALTGIFPGADLAMSLLEPETSKNRRARRHKVGRQYGSR